MLDGEQAASGRSHGVAAIIVHHRSYDTVPMTARSLIADGVQPDLVLVVDNSEDQPSRPLLAASLPGGVRLTHVANRGYGAAVNDGLRILGDRVGDAVEYVLVASHEAYADAGTIAKLRRALDEDPAAAVAGPTLLTGERDAPRIWSQGGYLSAVTHEPKHHGFCGRPSPSLRRTPVPREWMDGAFLLYRYSDLASSRFSEDYFLYMEDADLHVRLGREGRRILWVPEAVAWQSSQGVPAYHFARNIRLFYDRNDAVWRRRYVAGALVLRRLVAAVLRGGDPATIGDLVRGLRAPLPPAPGGGRADVVLVNPLGAALHHYETELVSVLPGRGRRVVRLSTAEPSASGRPRVLWLASFLLLLARAALRVRTGRPGRVIVTWPVLGYWDLVLLRMTTGRRGALVIHDPMPLVRAVGYGKVARRLASALGAGVGVVVHSEEARQALDRRLRPDDVAVLPHPVLPPREQPAIIADTRAVPRIRVLGQYKPERDLEALRRVAEDFGGRAVLEVHGRGWPPLDGWDVHAEFVTEPELDRLIASSAAVLIPYTRFYQSGIAIRCLEQATPVVGPRNTSLKTIFGEDSRLLVGPAGDWSRAVRHAIEHGRDEAALAARRWRAACERAWSEWDGTGDR